MRTFTVGELVSMAQVLIDAENQGNISAANWKVWLSSVYARLHGIVAETGFRYFETAATINTDGIASTFTLPADHFATTTVVRVVSADDRRPLRRLPAQLQVQMVTASGASAGSEACAYTLIAQDLWLGPLKPPSGQVYEHRYIPNAPSLGAAADSVVVDVATPDGESFVAHGMAVIGCMKQRMDPRDHARERDQAEARVAAWAAVRAFHDRHRQVTSGEAGGLYETGDYQDRSGW